MTATEKTIALHGGKTVVARFRDGMNRELKVRQLAVRELPDFLRLIDDEPGKIELCAGLTAAEVDNLTPESHEELHAAVEEVNSDAFFAWLRRRVQRQERLAPGSSGELGKALLSTPPTGSQNARSAAV